MVAIVPSPHVKSYINVHDQYGTITQTLVYNFKGNIVPGTAASGPQRAQRADARRNVSAILEAALSCLQRDPAASVVDIAAAAGVGRITLYGHFRTRAELVKAVFERTMERADAVLADVEVSGDPADGLAMLLSASWRIVEEFRMVLAAARRELDAEQIRAAHDRVMDRVHELVERGRREGAFRVDLPTEWMVASIVSLIHGSAEEVDAGRLDPDKVGRYLVTTVLAAFAPQRAGSEAHGAHAARLPTSARSRAADR